MARDKKANPHDAPKGQPRPGHFDPMAAVQELQGMVRDVRTRLTSPTIENLDDCRRRLDEAVKALEQLQTKLPTGHGARATALRAPLGALRSEIAAIAILLDGAAAFYTGWMRLASSMASGYTADGTPPPAEAQRRVSVEV